MAMSQSFRDVCGSDEAKDGAVDICSYCATHDKLQPATNFCFECGPCGRYICGICLRNHKLYLDGHDAIYIGSQANIDRNQKLIHDRKEELKLKKKNDRQETLLKQQSDELEKRRKHIQELENKGKDLESESQKNIRDQKKVQTFKKKIDRLETLLKEQNEELEKRREFIRELENRVKDLESDLNPVFRSKGELERQYQAEKEHLQRKYQEEIHAKEDALRRNKKENENYLNQVFQSRDDLEKKYRAENEHLHQKFQEEMRAKEDAMRSDQNRPTKIAEKLSELYDNQWTDAYDILERYGMDERQIIQTLLDALMTIYHECRRMSSENFFERVQRSIELPAEANEIPIRELALSDQLKQQIKEFRKTRAAAVAKDIEKVLKPRIQLAKHQAVQVQGFLSRCVEICWLCTVQDPPLVLTAQSSRGFDTNMFKDYTKRGRYVQYVVWPAMYLQEGGALLAKGVAQGIDHVQTSTKDDSNRKQPLHALPNAPVQEAFVRKTSYNKRERRNNPPTTFPDQQRQFSLVQSHHSSSSKTGTQSYTQKSQTVYSTRRTNVTTVDVKQGHGTAC